MRGWVTGMFFLAVASLTVAGCHPSKPCHCTQQQGCHCPAPPKKETPPPLPDTGTEQGGGDVHHHQVRQARHHRHVRAHYARAQHGRSHREARSGHHNRRHYALAERSGHQHGHGHRIRWAAGTSHMREAARQHERSWREIRRSHRIVALPYNYRSRSHRVGPDSGGAVGGAATYRPADETTRRSHHDFDRRENDRGFQSYERWRRRHRESGDWGDRDDRPPQAYGHDQESRRQPAHRQYLAERRLTPRYSINSGPANDAWHGYEADCPEGQRRD